MARFSFPSPGPRGSDESWFRVGTVDVTTTILVTGLAVLSMFAWALTSKAMANLILYWFEVRDGQIWRVVTWPLYNEPDLWAVIGIAIFYFFGRELERLMGRTRFLWYLLALALLPGLVATLLQLNAAGMRSIQLGCFVAYVVLYPQARSFFNIPLWVLGAVFIGIEVLQLIGVRDSRGIIFLFVVCATAVLGLSPAGVNTNFAWLPKFQIPARKKRPKKRKLKSVPTSSAAVRPVPTVRPGEGLRQAELDMLLDKIAAEGIDSLSPEERRRLDEASRRLRDEKD